MDLGKVHNKKAKKCKRSQKKALQPKQFYYFNLPERAGGYKKPCHHVCNRKQKWGPLLSGHTLPLKQEAWTLGLDFSSYPVMVRGAPYLHGSNGVASVNKWIRHFEQWR
ncbi:hypothetical protein CEXT_575351 [Caerostris extrusa]|uniref:Uncharacterized protein n=1 Tax=Caerostris extrusa TaxID=172846 RepID=A0AAV4W5Z9_CAEEX|nr:hypothetical protein CEXT_575351 [Caerostris extrusa]